MLMRRFAVSTFFVSLVVWDAGTASGQDYPNRPVRIVTSPIGGGGDFGTRIVAQGISGPLGQPVIAENRASNLIGEIVAKAPPDGYTLLWAGSTFLIGPLLAKTPYDPLTDFAPISTVGRAPNLVVVHPSLPVKSIKELIALAKARPGKLNYMSSTIGSPTHLGAELFKAMAGVDMVRVNYKGSMAGQTDLVRGEVQVSFGNVFNMMPYVKSGKLRALAVTSAQPSALAPGLPTVAASGLPGYETSSADAILAPAKTPATIINRLNQEIVRFLKTPEAKEKFLSVGIEAVGSSPEQLAARMKSEIATVSKLFRDAGVQVE